MKSSFFKKIGKIILWTSLFGIVFLLSTFLTIFILIRGETYTVPDLRGKTEEEAIKILAKKELYLKKRREVFSIEYPEGTIVKQYPEPGEKIKKNHFVMVDISNGGEIVKVPNLIQKNLNAAKMELRQYSLDIKRISSIHYKFQAEDIIAQNPPAGAQTFKRSGVNVLISSGPRIPAYIMPDLIGKDINLVMNYFEKKGLKIENIREVEYEGIPSGTIVRQTPLSGYKIKRGNIIILDVVK